MAHTADVLTAAAADRRAVAAAGWLARAGARAGDRVVVAAPAGADVVAVALGALRSGVVPVLLDPATPEGEFAELVADADPVAVLRGTAAVAAAAGGGPAGAPELAPVPLGRAMHYTSGTTGRRKGVWSGVLGEADARALWAEETALWAMTPDDVHVVLSPLYHSAPLRFAIATLLAGGTVVLPGRFAVGAFLDACAEHRPTTSFTAPAQLSLLRAAHDEGTERARVDAALGRMRLLAHAGAPCPEPVKRWLLERMPAERAWEFYGSTEGQFTACPGTEWLRRPGTVGRARPGRVLAADPAPDGGDGPGRIWCTVPEYARFSYWRDEQRTAHAWRVTPGGPAFTVGDTGRLDEEGHLYLLGRREDLVISGGVNVYPAEVERVLAEVPGVVELAVFGVDDERWGQRVEVAVTGAVDPAAVLEHAARELPPARRPKRVHVLDDLPRTSTGKILRRALPGLTADRVTPPSGEDAGDLPNGL